MGPIGVFDSGYGGLTILKEFINLMPEYDYIYLGDNARSPYGPRSFDTVYNYSLEAVKKLFEMGVHLVIIACNTASAKALRSIQQIDLPKLDPNKRVLGVIRPSVEAIASYSATKHIGILGTKGTILSKSYPLEIAKISPEIIPIQKACPMWVPLVENHEFDSEGADYFIKQDLVKILEQDDLIDTIILACTHYPILYNKIRNFLPENIKIISQGHIVAESLKDYLMRHPEMKQNCKKTGKYQFYTTDSPEVFQENGSIFCSKVNNVQHISL